MLQMIRDRRSGWLRLRMAFQLFFFFGLVVVLVVHVNDLLNLALGTEEDTTLVVDGLGANFHEALHARVHGETACILKDHGHGGTLVQDAQLTLGALLVSRVGKDTTVQQGAVGVSDHGADVSSTVGLATVCGSLQTVKVRIAPVIPVHAVTLVDGVNGARFGKLHVGMSKDELAQRVLESEAVDATAAHGDDQLRGSAVHGEAGGDKFRSGETQNLRADLLALTNRLLGELEDTEDGADGDTRVEVGGAVDGITDHSVPGIGVLIEGDHLLFFLGDDEAALAGAAHGGDEDVIADHVELLLVITGCVGGTGQAGQVDQRSPTDVVCDGLEGELQSVAEECEVTRGLGVLGLLFREEAGERDNVQVHVLVADGTVSVVRHVE